MTDAQIGTTVGKKRLTSSTPDFLIPVWFMVDEPLNLMTVYCVGLRVIVISDFFEVIMLHPLQY
ncbi:MAG TPA: hypothetical protein ENK78_03080, partial [Thiothrix sp.]|nr:hypothetical protein [Thiothrix sp.]